MGRANKRIGTSRQSLPYRAEGSSFKCRCGKEGFVDLGEKAPNRYPCRECYEKIRGAWMFKAVSTPDGGLGPWKASGAHEINRYFPSPANPDITKD